MNRGLHGTLEDRWVRCLRQREHQSLRPWNEQGHTQLKELKESQLIGEGKGRGRDKQCEAGKVGGGQVNEGLTSHEGEAPERCEVIMYAWITDCRVRCPGEKTQSIRWVTLLLALWRQ